MADYMYLVQLDIPAELEDAFNRVYDTQLIPNLLKAPGVNSCTRYRLESSDVDGVARYATVFELDSPEVLQSAAWKAESDKGDWKATIGPHTGNRSHSVFKKYG